MRALLLLLPLLCAVLPGAGCGKSAQERETEARLRSRITALRDAALSQMVEFRDLEDRIAAAIARHDSLAGLFSRSIRDHTADDLQAARAGLEAARDKMDIWLWNVRPPDSSLAHDETVARLETAVRDLEALTSEIEAARGAAARALAEHRAAADALEAGGTGE